MSIEETAAVEAPPAPAPRVLVLIATIPARKQFCGWLLNALAKQTRKPDGVIFVLDGYGDAPAPATTLPVVAEYRTTALSGAGQRWRVALDLPPEDIIICLDDDITLLEAPNLVRGLVAAIEKGGGAAAAMGRGADGKFAPPCAFSRGDIMHGLGCGLTVRAKHLVGLQAFSATVVAAGGPDALGVLGDDDALVSAYLWKTGVKIRHAATGNIYAAAGTKTTASSAAREARKENFETQKLAIKKITGWPWFAFIPGAPGQVQIPGGAR